MCLCYLIYAATILIRSRTSHAYTMCVKPCRLLGSVLTVLFSAGIESEGKYPDPSKITWLCVSMASEINQSVQRVFHRLLSNTWTPLSSNCITVLSTKPFMSQHTLFSAVTGHLYLNHGELAVSQYFYPLYILAFTSP